MKPRTKLTAAAALILALGIGVYAYTAHSQDRHDHPSFGPMMGMMGMLTTAH
jgi:hypothetical protein